MRNRITSVELERQAKTLLLAGSNQRAEKRETARVALANRPKKIRLRLSDREQIARDCGVILADEPVSPTNEEGLAHHYKEPTDLDVTAGRPPLRVKRIGPCNYDIVYT